MDFKATAFDVIKRAYKTYINVLMVLSCFLKGLKKRHHSCLFGLRDGCFNNDLIHGHETQNVQQNDKVCPAQVFPTLPCLSFFIMSAWHIYLLSH